jgi:hypothetical protein
MKGVLLFFQGSSRRSVMATIFGLVTTERDDSPLYYWMLAGA